VLEIKEFFVNNLSVYTSFLSFFTFQKNVPEKAFQSGENIVNYIKKGPGGETA
jgi:hypothetical protein